MILNPRPPRSVRVSKRAAGALMADRRYHPRTLRLRRLQASATTGRNVGRGEHAAQRRTRHGGRRRDREGRTVRECPEPPPQSRLIESGTLVPPGELQSAQAGPAPQGGQVFVRQAPIPAQPVVAQIPQPREPSPEERRLLAAYEREQQAIAAPTTLTRRLRIARARGRSQHCRRRSQQWR